MSKQKAVPDLWAEERAARQRGFKVICGIDEAGRGPLAGPVVAAAVVLPPDVDLPGINDSKKLTPEQRSLAYDRILAVAEGYSIVSVDAETIDRLNILKATHEAMRGAVGRLSVLPDLALIDGLPVRPFPVYQQALVKGDSRSISIAAASILAKVTRDRWMEVAAETYPAYNFAKNKGYPTPDHLELLEKHGPCPIHRKSFAPVAKLLPDAEKPQRNLFGDTAITGEAGETIACAHLRRGGFEILETRYRVREGEIDIVAKENDVLVFVEVKARHGSRGTTPSEAVHSRKRARLVAAAEAYLYDHPEWNGDVRFDVVEAVFLPDGYATVNHIRSAFVAGD